MSRVLAVDPGEARIGLAVSDPSQTLARPLKVIRHKSRKQDAAAIVRTALELEASTIVVGVAYDIDSESGPQARKALRLVEVLRSMTDIPIEIWDESGSSLAAARGRAADRILDARAAAVILQEYLDAKIR